eukprot:scaffold565_cov379-Pinguiococcus_pyrenoidosus.AAC.3
MQRLALGLHMPNSLELVSHSICRVCQERTKRAVGQTAQRRHAYPSHGWCGGRRLSVVRMRRERAATEGRRALAPKEPRTCGIVSRSLELIARMDESASHRCRIEDLQARSAAAQSESDI